ncbi:DNA polymerase III subunit delta' C-terminal domain-containing protein [Balneolales bacterium ANBcel1]|nr:DNA polymerase III subunit delta' C-terminal domain-containing protein [Balneolales bacterium ANBcel1]
MTHPSPSESGLLGERRLIGQHSIRSKMLRMVSDDRLSHAYLLTGQPGTGKKPLALAFAEAVNGVENLGTPPSGERSARRSWYFHPDIHVFLPLPGNVSTDELRARLELLAADPYEIVDFSTRPALTGQDSGKNRQAFYSKEYFNTHVRRAASLKPGEGRRNIIIISNVEKMRTDVVNSFLKLLEEPGKNVMFILTTDNVNSLLPTVISRCQLLPCQPLATEEVFEALRTYDGLPEDQARFLARISGGNYSFTRFYDLETLQQNREDIIRYLRLSYTVDVGGILEMSQKWHAEYNKEGQLAIISMIETFLRDIALYSAGVDESMITNSDRIEVIRNFCNTLRDARIEAMIRTLEEARTLLAQNVQARLLFTVIANRFAAWMRGLEAPVPSDEPWKHMPAYAEQ